jgi:hypothetical protein
LFASVTQQCAAWQVDAATPEQCQLAAEALATCPAGQVMALHLAFSSQHAASWRT